MAELGSAELGSAELGSAELGSAELGSAELGSAELGMARKINNNGALLYRGNHWQGGSRSIKRKAQ